MKSMERLESEIIAQRYIELGHNKTQTAISLNISLRSLFDKLKKIITDYPDLLEDINNTASGAKDEYFCSCFPTNKFRIEYRDKGL